MVRFPRKLIITCRRRRRRRAREQKRRIELQPAKVAITCYKLLFFSTTHAAHFIVAHTRTLFSAIVYCTH